MNDELRKMLPELSAYADGELQGEDLRRVEAYVRAHPEAQAIVNSYRGVDEDVAGLGSSKTDAEWERLALRVDAAIDAEAAGRATARAVAPARPGGLRRWFTPSRVAFSSIGTLAAALMVLVLYPFRDALEPSSSKRPGTGTFESMSDEGSIEASSRPVAKLRALPSEEESPLVRMRDDDASGRASDEPPSEDHSVRDEAPETLDVDRLRALGYIGDGTPARLEEAVTESKGEERAGMEETEQSESDLPDALAPSPPPASQPAPAAKAVDLRKTTSFTTKDAPPALGYSNTPPVTTSEGLRANAEERAREGIARRALDDEATFDSLLGTTDETLLLVLAGDLDAAIENAPEESRGELLEREARVWWRLVELNPDAHCATARARAERRIERAPSDSATLAADALKDVCPPGDSR